MASPELEVSVTLPCVVGIVPCSELGKERARVFGQRVESESINGDSENLFPRCERFGWLFKSLHIISNRIAFHRSEISSDVEDTDLPIQRNIKLSQPPLL